MLSRGILKGSNFSFNGIVTNLEKTVSTINQIVPLYNQVKPLINNSKSMFSGINNFFKRRQPINNNRYSQNIINVEAKEQTQKKEKILETPNITSPNKPFFN